MLDKLLKFYNQQHDKLIHAMKTMLAVLIGFCFMLLLPYPRSYWIVITIAVIMTSESILGLQVNKSILRIVGTLLGALLGIFTIVVSHNYYFIGLMLALVTFGFVATASYFKDISYASVMGIITFSMITLTQTASLETAVYRIIDILLGILICLVVSRFILPLNSKHAFVKEAKAVCLNLADIARLIFIEKKQRQQSNELFQLESNTTAKITKQQTLVKATHYESFKRDTTKDNITELIRFQRAIYRYLLFLNLPYNEIKETNPKQFDSIDKTIVPFIELYQQYLASFSNNAHQPDININALIKLEQQLAKDSQYHTVIHYILVRLIKCLDRFSKNWRDLQEKL